MTSEEASREISSLRDIQRELMIARERTKQELVYLLGQIYEVDARIAQIARDAIE